ncbi:MAG: class I SAM-dependent methyltransferase [Rhodospirillaceae bacterium]|nr:class I SAM-dependent methyltransferase [Rhodospirillaceae bacterium]
MERVIREGTLVVTDASGHTHRIVGTDQPEVAIRLHDKSLHAKLAIRPELYLGEAYMDGTLTIEQGTIYDFLDLCGRNIRHFENYPLNRVFTRLSRIARDLQQHNPIGHAQRNVAHHYDLSESLYNLFLDNDRQYSCAYFDSGNDSLEVAQEKKKRHLAAKLLLEPGQTVLDIGCGWGGLALYLAQAADVRVVGVTLSKEQHKVACERAEAAGLADRVEFRLQDYREVPERFDRIVSVGMFEHVGAKHYGEYFEKAKELLVEDGVFVLHSIGRMEQPASTNPWLRKYIFPGGYTPALSEALTAIERVGLWVNDIEILRLHYAKTLAEWLRRFDGNRDKVKALYDERFCRMWEFYLAGCEISFRYMKQMVFQAQISKTPDAVPITRDYIQDWERTNLAIGDAAE